MHRHAGIRRALERRLGPRRPSAACAVVARPSDRAPHGPATRTPTDATTTTPSRPQKHPPARWACLDQAVVEDGVPLELLPLQQGGVAQPHNVAPAAVALRAQQLGPAAWGGEPCGQEQARVEPRKCCAPTCPGRTHLYVEQHQRPHRARHRHLAPLAARLVAHPQTHLAGQRLQRGGGRACAGLLSF